MRVYMVKLLGSREVEEVKRPELTISRRRKMCAAFWLMCLQAALQVSPCRVSFHSACESLCYKNQVRRAELCQQQEHILHNFLTDVLVQLCIQCPSCRQAN